MSVTIQNIITLHDSYTGEDTEERISNEERYECITEAVADIKQRMKGDMSNMTYSLEYIPGVHYYKINQGIYNVLAGADIRVSENDRTNASLDVPFMRSSAQKIAEDITKKRFNTTYALDRYDGDLYIALSYEPVGSKSMLSDMGSITGVTLSGDATNLELDISETVDGQALKFDIDVSNDVANSATINVPIDLDLTTFKYTGSVVGSVFIQDASNTTSVGVKLQTDISNYYTFTAPTPFNKTSFTDGWNRIVVSWDDMVETGTVDIEDINFIDITINYDVAQTDTVARVDDFYIAKPTKLIFHYLSYSVGKDTLGTEIVDFTALTDVPYFSGQYDNIKFAVAKFSAAITFQKLRLYEQAAIQEQGGERKLRQVMNLIPSSHTVETKSFRPSGVNFTRNRGYRR